MNFGKGNVISEKLPQPNYEPVKAAYRLVVELIRAGEYQRIGTDSKPEAIIKAFDAFKAHFDTDKKDLNFDDIN
ncbi:hypothetical protein [Moellerella wisconsensis]|uniref:hypothetical protein n=1 Tax=Moellerella wisconsensis TaxID=158849 RepID=UPI001F4EF740|nr:hypothetical protein [Moellerella wisconsensis]UNH23025.1 hypothetical protein MNY68_09135 [Moellerella wisconsensis]